MSRGGENEAVLQVLPYLGKRPDVKNLSKGKNLRSIMHRQRLFVTGQIDEIRIPSVQFGAVKGNPDHKPRPASGTVSAGKAVFNLNRSVMHRDNAADDRKTQAGA